MNNKIIEHRFEDNNHNMVTIKQPLTILIESDIKRKIIEFIYYMNKIKPNETININTLSKYFNIDYKGMYRHIMELIDLGLLKYDETDNLKGNPLHIYIPDKFKKDLESLEGSMIHNSINLKNFKPSYESKKKTINTNKP